MHGCRKEERKNAVGSYSCPVTIFPSIHRGRRPPLSTINVLTHCLVLVLLFRPGGGGSLVAELLWVAPHTLPLVGQAGGGPGVVRLRDPPHDGCYGEPEAPAGGSVLQLREGRPGPDQREDRALPLRRRRRA